MLSDGFHGIPPCKVAMIVTHLEMRAAQLRNAPLPSGLEFTPLPRDLDVYRGIFNRVGQEWLWYARAQLDDAALRKIIEDPRVKLFTLRKDGMPEALLELDFRVENSCELSYFGLSAALIGSGAGSYLMDQAITQAFDAGIERFHLHTCTIDSPQAFSFYRRSGFTPIRQQVEISDDPRLLGILPPEAAPNVPIFKG
ncbi:MAG: GNAT family N-acetyltransferase [Roseobacter sp.]